MQRVKLFFLVMLVFLCMGILAGCWDLKELENLQIPTIAGFDTVLESEKETPRDRFLISVGWPIFSENAAEKFQAMGTPGYMIGDTRSRRNTHVGEQLVLGQLQVLVLGREFAETENVTEYMDIINRNPSVKGTILMAVADGRAVDILKKKVKQYADPAEYMKTLLKGVKKTSFYTRTTLFEYDRDTLTDYSAPLLPLVRIEGDDIVMVGSCLMNDGKIAAQLGMEETQTADLVRGERGYSTLSYDVVEKGEKIDRVSVQCKNNRKIKVYKSGDKYSIELTIKLTGSVVEHNSLTFFENDNDLLELCESSLEDKIRADAEKFVAKTKEQYKFDALCAAKYIKAHTRETLTKKDIDRIIQEADVKVDVKVKLVNTLGKM